MADGKEQFLRVATLTAVNKQGVVKVFSGLRIKFTAEKTSESTPNKAKIQIFNLNEGSRTFLEGEGIRISLAAGYPNNIDIVASGNVTKPISVHKQPDWITTIESGDGQKEMQEKNINVSFTAGTPFSAIFSQGLSALGVTSGPSLFNISEIANGGYSYSGPVKTMLDVLAKRFGLQWSVQEGAVQVSQNNLAVPGVAVVVSEVSGLIGNIIKREKSIEFTNLINAKIKPSRSIIVSSTIVSGLYKVKKVLLDGDTHSGPWFSKVEAEPLS